MKECTSIWSGFYKKAIIERQSQLYLNFPALFNQKSSFPLNGLELNLADNMIENCIGTIGLPIGLALNFDIDASNLVVPMVIEEPSVVAAVSGAAKTISLNGGFKTRSANRNIVISQIQLMDVLDSNIENVIAKLEESKSDLINSANLFCQSMCLRGGGVINMEIRKIPNSNFKQQKTSNAVSNQIMNSFHLIIHFTIDACDAMGANLAATIAEGVSPQIQRITNARIGLQIVSNLSPDRLTTSKFEIPLKNLAYKYLSGQQVASRIIEAYYWATDDPFRAITHNKGIMNGIDAVSVATGQDWRAIEAAAHLWASRDGAYRPLTRYWVETKNSEEVFCGELELPICCGTKGGVLLTNPAYAYGFGLMGNPDSNRLARIICSVGLAQNFAALRALVSEGIQRGHMSLHAGNIAIAAGAPTYAINECVDYMIESKRISLAAAKEYVEAHALHSDLILEDHDINDKPQTPRPPPSMFYFEEAGDDPEKISLNIAFKTLGKSPVNIEFTQNEVQSGLNGALITKLLGKKSHVWLTQIFHLLGSIKLNTLKPPRKNLGLSRKLKLLSILLNILIRRMMSFHPKETRNLIAKLYFGEDSENRNLKSDTLKNVVIDDFKSSTELFTLNLKPKSSPILEIHEWSSTELFNSSLFNDSTFFSSSNQSLSNKPISEPTLLEIGLPLVVAILQVFELRVNQWVGNKLLRAELLNEHRKVLVSLISPLNFKTPPSNSTENIKTLILKEPTLKNNIAKTLITKVDLKKVINLNSKRFQVSIFLLCDAISCDSSLITTKSLEFLNLLGLHLEREQSVCHDLSPERLTRDLFVFLKEPVSGRRPWLSRDGGLDWGDTVNSFVLFLVYKFGVEMEKKKSLVEIRDEIREYFVCKLKSGDFGGSSRFADNDVDNEEEVCKVVHELFSIEIGDFLRFVYSKEAGWLGDLFFGSFKGQPLDIFDFEKFKGAAGLYREYYRVSNKFVFS